MNIEKRRGKRRKSLFPYLSPAGERYILYRDMLEQPHLLIAGATGSGKSVVINALIYTALFNHPKEGSGGAQFILIDPKRVELSQYKALPHVLQYASEPDEMRQAIYNAMKLCEYRYKIMQKSGERLYSGGNVYLIIDEFADLMTTQKRLIMPPVQRLAQIGRAARVHIILATQTPIAKVLPTEIKCNFDARLALRTRSAQDSRNITGFPGCERLPRYGSGYYMTPEKTTLTALPLIDEKELAARVKWWTDQKSPLQRMKNRLAL